MPSSGISVSSVLGMRLGKLIIIDPDSPFDAYTFRFKAKCDCGAVIVMDYLVGRRDLQFGRTPACIACEPKSQPPLPKECSGPEDNKPSRKALPEGVVGRRYGRLVVTAEEFPGAYSFRVKAKCDCGAVVSVDYRTIQGDLAASRVPACINCEEKPTLPPDL